MAVQENRQVAENQTRLTEFKKTSPRVYRDVPGLDITQLDVLEQLNLNLSNLEDLHGRLRFMLAEIKPLIQRR